MNTTKERDTLIRENVQEYYGETLKSSADLKTSACCPIDAIPANIRPLLGNVHEEIISRFYGCGSPIPPALEGKTVLDLGSGTGRDCYILSQLVGEQGTVIGVDMTQEQLDCAEKHIPYHMEKFGYAKPNVQFKLGQIEDLSTAGIEENSIDCVISNCVINLSPNKSKVFKEIHRVLKPGGELYFSDVFANRRIPNELQEHKEMVGECLGGAMYIEDFRRNLNDIGFADYRAISQSQIQVDDPEIKKLAGMIGFYSITIRTFKCDFEDICENYGHVAYYQGNLEGHEHSFVLDDHHEFLTGLPYPVCGNTAKMLSETRFAPYFKVIGDFSTHYGEFDCAESPSGTDSNTISSACC